MGVRGDRSRRHDARTFHDIVEGANDYAASEPGWDHITGLGTPRVDALAAALASRSP